MLSRFRRHAPVLLVLSTVSCFDYSQVEPANIQPGHDVQIAISPEGRRALASQVGTNVRTVSGRLLSIDTSGVQLALARTTLTDGSGAQWSGEQVTIPTQYIDGTQERTLSKPKTVGALAILAGVGTAVALALGRVGSSGSSTVPGSPAK